MTEIPHLTEATLQGLEISTQDVIAMMERVIIGAQNGSVWAAPKAVILPPDGRYMMATLAAMDDPPLVATKSLVLNEANIDAGLPQINGLVTLLSSQTGLPVATMDGNWITAVRTAGLSAVAAKYMANPDAGSVAFLGTGLQARSHLTAFAEMFPLKSIKIYGRGQTNIDRLSQLADDLGLQSTTCATPETAMTGADLVVSTITHTGVAGPFLDADWLSEGCHATAVDLAVPWHKESFAGLDNLIIDDLAQEETQASKIADPVHIKGDLTALVTGKIKGRSGASDRTMFAFRGHALGDLAMAALAYVTYERAS